MVIEASYRRPPQPFFYVPTPLKVSGPPGRGAGVVGVLGGPWGLWKSLEVFRGLGILVVICIFHQRPFYAFLVFASLCFAFWGP